MISFGRAARACRSPARLRLSSDGFGYRWTFSYLYILLPHALPNTLNPCVFHLPSGRPFFPFLSRAPIPYEAPAYVSHTNPHRRRSLCSHLHLFLQVDAFIRSEQEGKPSSWKVSSFHQCPQKKKKTVQSQHFCKLAACILPSGKTAAVIVNAVLLLVPGLVDTSCSCWTTTGRYDDD